MSHRCQVQWKNDGSPFTPETYSRDHTWTYGGGVTHGASAAPDYHGNAGLVDPEQAFTASLSACHMLTFLAICAHKKIEVLSYDDEAEGFLGKNEQGKMAMTRVVLRPKVAFGENAPSEEALEKLHHRAHRGCFVASSVTTKVDIEPRP